MFVLSRERAGARVFLRRQKVQETVCPPYVDLAIVNVFTYQSPSYCDETNNKIIYIPALSERRRHHGFGIGGSPLPQQVPLQLCGES